MKQLIPVLIAIVFIACEKDCDSPEPIVLTDHNSIQSYTDTNSQNLHIAVLNDLEGDSLIFYNILGENLGIMEAIFPIMNLPYHHVDPGVYFVDYQYRGESIQTFKVVL